MKFFKKELNNTKFITIFTFYILLFLGVIYLFSIKIETSGALECDSGFIGLNLETQKEAEYLIDGEGKFRETEFEENKLKNLSIKNIEGLNCKGSFSAKVPLLLLFGGI